MKDYNDLSDIELLSEYNELCNEMEEMEETDYGSYSYDCLNSDLEYIYNLLSKRGLV